jgi:hypothetical protein
MATTTNYGFPSPNGTAPPQGPYDIKALADALDAWLYAKFADTGWVDLVLAGFTPMAGTEKPQIRKRGNEVQLRGGWLTGAGTGITAASSTVQLANAGGWPAGFVPPVNSIAVCAGSSGAATANLHINADGSAQLRLNATLGAYYKMDRQSYWLD